MKKSLLLFCPLVLLTLVMVKNKNQNKSYTTALIEKKLSNSIDCTPGATELIAAGADGKFITHMPGWGNHSYAITTQNDSAQIYFNQGLTMYYSYHSREAVASFKEAAKFDSSAAMAYWGQALAMGPSYNFGYMYKLNPQLSSVLAKMNAAAANASPKEKDLIAAMTKRYNIEDAADKQRSRLNESYALAMKQLVVQYPDDIDIKALYTDAVMLIHPWDFWFNDGRAKEWTPELVKNCEDILKEDPQHPAALHYYIHVTEASREPERALPGADSLIKLFPGVAHMVHMSSHEYERIGYYAKGVDANEKADRSLVVYDSLAKGLYPMVHVPHYYAVDAYCAFSGAMYEKAKQKTSACRNIAEPTHEKTYDQYLYMYPAIAMVRMGKWQEILQEKVSIKPEWNFAGVLNDFAKGMAYAKTGAVTKAQQHLQQLKEKKTDSILMVRFAPYKNNPYECALVAENILAATILFEQKKYDAAIASIKKAIAAEDSLLYAEPKIWLLPARQYLGSFLLKLKRPAEAEKVYRDDLRWNPGNGWSLLGLYQSLKTQQKTGELKKLKAMYTYSFSGADILPAGSVY